MLKNLLLISTIVIASTPAISNDAAGTGVMKLLLPSTGSGVNGSSISQSGVINAHSQSFLVKGEILIAAQRQCGDNDVYNFHNANPTFEYHDGAQQTVKQVFGYWLSSANGDQSPSEESWQPVFYNNIDISGDGYQFKATSKLGSVPGRITPATQYKLGEVVKGRLSALMLLLGKKFENNKDPLGKPTDKFQLHASAMVCNDYSGDTSAIAIDSMNSYDIALSFIGTSPLRTTLASKKDNLTDLTRLEKLSKYNFQESVSKLQPDKLMTANSGALNISFSPTGEFTLGNNELFKIAKEILQNIEMTPANPSTPLSDADKVTAYNKLIRETGGIYLKLQSAQSAFKNQIVPCSNITVNGKAISLTDKLWFYPAKNMNIECQSLHNSFVKDFNEFFKEATTASDIPSSSTFISNRSHLAFDLFESAALYESQNQASITYTNKETRRCFNPLSPYINTILNSGALKVSIQSSGADLVLGQSVDPIHHESGFAITSTTRQDYADHNEKIVFSSRSPLSAASVADRDAILDLSVALPVVSAKTIVDAIGIKLNVRSLAGSSSGSCVGPTVCFNSFGNQNEHQW